MKKRIILSLAMIVVTIAAVTSATVAYFTATASNSDNTFTAGTLTVDFNNPSTVPVNLTDMQPGEEKTLLFDVRNTGTLHAYIAAYATGIWNFGGAVEASKFWLTKTEYYEGGSWHTLKTGSPITGVVYYGASGESTTLYDVAPSAVVPFRLTVKLADDAGDDFQGKIFAATINIGAKQTTPGATWPAGF